MIKTKKTSQIEDMITIST